MNNPTKKTIKENSGEMVKSEYIRRENPFYDLSTEAREHLIRKVGEKGKKDYKNSLKELKEFIRNFDILDILCHFSMYHLSSPVGVNQELEENNPTLQFHVEILQSLALQIENKKENRPFLGKDAVKIEELIKTITNSLFYKRYPLITGNEKEREKLFNIEMFRLQSMSIRNWGYKEQVIRLTKELFEPIDDIIRKELNLSIISLMEMLESLIKYMEENLNKRSKMMREVHKSSNVNQMIDLFTEFHPFFSKKTLLNPSKFKSKGDFANYLIFGVGDQYIKDLFTFKLADCISLYPEEIDEKLLNTVLDNWSIEIGGLKDFNTDYIFFGNPIWDKPLIKLDESKYCWPIPGTFLSFCIELMESVIKRNSRLKKIYEKRRGKFLEEKIENLFKKCFKNAAVYNNLIRLDEDGENDLLAIIDTYAIIIEAKSGKISASARRGAPERLKKEIDELLIQPSKQAKRFAEFIRKNLCKTEFTNKNHEKIFIDFSKIQHVLTFGVTFDFFGPLAARTPLLFEASLVDDESEISPSMTLVDLEILLEMLETDSEKVHYLSRRSQFDKNVAYHADELDLIGFYLQTGFNIGQTPKDVYFELYGASQDVLDAYYLNKQIIPKPRPRRTEWWQDLINKIEFRNNFGWLKLTLQLLNVSYEDQLKFERGVKKVIKIVEKDWKNPKHINQVLLLNEIEKEKELLICYCYKDKNTAERNENIKIAAMREIEKNKLKQALVISLDVENLYVYYPYSAIGLIVKNEH